VHNVSSDYYDGKYCRYLSCYYYQDHNKRHHKCHYNRHHTHRDTHNHILIRKCNHFHKKYRHRFGHAVCSVDGSRWGLDTTRSRSNGKSDSGIENFTSPFPSPSTSASASVSTSAVSSKGEVNAIRNIGFYEKLRSKESNLLVVFGGVDADHDFGDFWVLKMMK